ncbi:MAG: rRNA maturation RNase YbeY [Candidatus Woesebacteria bacterium]|nr:rRNA maturation RNase YbeY [Candidatus Woesebacteria bacterium]
MITVNVSKQSNFPVKSSLIKKRLREFLVKEGIVSDCVVSVAVVGEEKMLEIGKKHLKDKLLHNVLSFTESEIKGDFIYPPDGKIYLGDIIICYPKVLEEAKEEGTLIDEKACDLVEHGALHLLGKHHE